MTTAECARWRPMLGAHALGHLGERESAALRAHLDACADCKAEAMELSRIETALKMVDPERIESVDEPDHELERRILEQVRQEQSQRSRRVRWAVAAALAAVLVVVAVLFVVAPFERTQQRVEFEGAPSGVTASATFQPRPWGTEIQLVVEGLPSNHVYSVWLQTADGSRVSSGSFRAVREGKVTMVLSSALSLEEATAIGVNSEGNTVMTAALNG